MRDLWSRTFHKDLPRIRRCPSCVAPMLEVSMPQGTAFAVLDVCRACQFVWFDPSEFESLPALPAKPLPVNGTPQPVREAVALAQVKRMVMEQTKSPPDLRDIRNIPAFLGMPVEMDQNAFRRFPWLTWTVAGLLIWVSLMGFRNAELLVNYGLVPSEAWRLGGLTLVSSIFLHGGVLHLLGNLYFLIVFGDNIEDYLGRRRWLLLFFVAAISGGLLHVIGDPRSTMPCVGASGGISGLLAFYAFRFPKARLETRIWMRYTLRSQWITFPAWGGFAVWMILQCFGILQQVGGFCHVSSLAHVGGALAGVAAWLLWRNFETHPDLLPHAKWGEVPPVRNHPP